MHRSQCRLAKVARTRTRSVQGFSPILDSISAESKNLVYDTFANINTIATDELVSRVDRFAAEGLRAPVRDLSAFLCSSLSETSPATLAVLVRCLVASGRLQVYEPRLFELLVANREHLSVSDLCVAVYECGRHGLRAKHFFGPLTQGVSDKISDLTARDVWRLWAGVSKHPREHRQVLAQSMGVMERSLGNFSVRELSVPMRTTKELRFVRQFQNFQGKVAAAVGRQLDRRPCLSELGLVMAASEKYEETSDAVFEGVVCRAIELLSNCQAGATADNSGFQGVDTVALVDSLHTISSWKRRLTTGAANDWLGRVSAELVRRRAEIKYSPNCGLWHVALMAADKLVDGNEPGKFPCVDLVEMVLSFCRDRFMLDRVSVWQVVDVLRVSSARRVYDAAAYDAMAEVIKTHVDELKHDVKKIASVMAAMSSAGHKLDDRLAQVFASRLASGSASASTGVCTAGEQAGDLLWSIAVQKKLNAGKDAAATFHAAEMKLLSVLRHSPAAMQSSKRKLVQVRQVYGLAAVDAELQQLQQPQSRTGAAADDHHVFTEISTDPKSGRDQRRERRQQVGSVLITSSCPP